MTKQLHIFYFHGFRLMTRYNQCIPRKSPPMSVSQLIWLNQHDRLGITVPCTILFDVRATSNSHHWNADFFYVRSLVIDTPLVNSQHSSRDIAHSHGFPAYQTMSAACDDSTSWNAELLAHLSTIKVAWLASISVGACGHNIIF